MSVAVLAIATATPGETGLWDEDLHDELLVRVSRGTKERGTKLYFTALFYLETF